MKRAILSDIHSNLEALRAVLEDATREGAGEIVCLGDVVGYGPNPRECVELAMGWKVVLMGNHDHAVLFEPQDFNPIAEEATRWTRRELETPVPDRGAVDRRWEFLSGLPQGHTEAGAIFVHGSARQPLHEYVFPADVRNTLKMDRLFGLIGRCCFQGHTHVPGVFTQGGEFLPAGQLQNGFALDGRKVMCNVGSVGQPRDGDWRACYVLFDGDTIRYRRVEYDVETTVRKIHAVKHLDRFLGDRLLMGR